MIFFLSVAKVLSYIAGKSTQKEGTILPLSYQPLLSILFPIS